MLENMYSWIQSAKTVVSNVGGRVSDTRNMFAVFLSWSVYRIVLPITGYLRTHMHRQRGWLLQISCCLQISSFDFSIFSNFWSGEYLIYHSFMTMQYFQPVTCREALGLHPFIKFRNQCFAQLQVFRKSGKLSNHWAAWLTQKQSQAQTMTDTLCYCWQSFVLITDQVAGLTSHKNQGKHLCCPRFCFIC